ncbi:hypothetical protein COW99_04730 [Candidatus Roizmanbacteria bacterium CG22_combo_CG10-13_8_21_14_all_38_20]|uniref:Addiction module toxin, HicA family n=1 Tax=Candidatus Roizmanbacteria bacterium CG22_combo_CG10-13_8_21_14_all_38_20 TaxID=1974862 RepID=A0A2H0BW65_9BACT|nr:addiction module toxin, HicA family [Candidatus Microgenomates bacterium]PIP61290.1 MAG: hypothetical protein COW99_04730 [Candidatus Roizmanbacteria bacterium CG22_combo_CG10-13_8_21_14_all_38_20]PJC31084.1 MAG: hypothetical protein CO050_04455 [Candidatus Roizmanbacteria bacterium CG_4_9_14_0_2_um_filter_38_17]
MPKLPQIKPRKLLKILLKLDFTIKRQKGSHVRLHGPKNERVTLAIHNKPLAKGTLNAILKQAELSVEELIGSL